MFGLRIALGCACAQWLCLAFFAASVSALPSGFWWLWPLLTGRKSRAEKGAVLAAVLWWTVWALFCLPRTFLVPHGTEHVHGLHEITQLPQNLARTLTQICSDTNQSLWPLHNIRMFQLSRTPNYRWDESLEIDSALSGYFYLDSLGPAFKVGTLAPSSAAQLTATVCTCSHMVQP